MSRLALRAVLYLWFSSTLCAGGSIAPGTEPSSVDWRSLLKQSALFLGIEHGYRFATEPGTRQGFLNGHFLGGYADSVTNLHGWADGDPFLVNYVGHPMQGSVAGYIWIQNDPRYRNAEFGRNHKYWTSRARAAGFAWAYSEQFEIGPFSEASLGHIQHYYPQQGFVDHVVTPVVGLGWMIAEDAVDQYIIKRIEGKTRNFWVRILIRGGLNPSRSFANLMAFQAPWVRTTRPGARLYDASIDPTMHPRVRQRPTSEPSPLRPPKFAFASIFSQTALLSSSRTIGCAGGGATASYSVTPELAIDAEVSGCKFLGQPAYSSGDAGTYLIGPRWTYRGSERWKPYVHVLLGAEKLTEETTDPAARARVLATAPKDANIWDVHNEYTTRAETTGLALKFGGGVEWALNQNFAVRVGEFQFGHAWVNDLDGSTFGNDVRVTTGVVLRLGSAR